VRPSPPLCDAVRHGRCQSRDTVPPTLVWLMRRAFERGQRSPRRGDRRLLHAYPRLHRDVRPAGQSPPSSVLCDHHRRPNTIPGTASPSPTLWGYGATRRRHTSCCAPYGLPSAAPSSQCTDDDSTETPTPPPSKPLLGGHRARHDALLKDQMATREGGSE
jgi:hypothetical protein